jgi:hypothetical protein
MINALTFIMLCLEDVLLWDGERGGVVREKLPKQKAGAKPAFFVVVSTPS